MSNIPTMPDPTVAPPRDKDKKPRALRQLERAMDDDKAVQKARDLATGLLFYDKDSPAIQKRRENARAVFEGYCEKLLNREDLTPAEMWNKETILARTWETIFFMAEYAEGKIENKPKAGVLYQYKQSLYWWIIRFIPDFSTIFVQWNNIVNAAIHKAAIAHNFGTAWLEKNRLGDAELSLFYKSIPSFESGRENWKQHYIAWVLTFMTSVRPGSMTVCPGYQKGSLQADGKTVRAEDETLRWSDIHFFRTTSGIAFKINFHYLKGSRDPYANKMRQGKRKFTLLPLNSARYHLDLTLLLTGYAFSRGLFSAHESLESLWSGDELVLVLDENVKQQAVFVAADHAGALVPSQPMVERALNTKLQDMCDAAGLFQRNTMYSFRRTAIVEARRKHGTETAQELATHTTGSQTIFSYDDESLEDLDLANDRLNLQTMARADIRRMFAQVNTARVPFDPAAASVDTTSSSASLIEELNKETNRRARLDGQFSSATQTIRQHYADIKMHLVSTLNVDNAVLVNDKDYDDQLRAHESSDPRSKELLGELPNLVKTRMNLLRNLRRKYKPIIKQEMLANAQATQKMVKSKGKSMLGTRGASSPGELDLVAAATDPSVQATQVVDAVSALETGVDTLEDDVGDAEDAAAAAEPNDEDLDATHTESKAWESLPDEVTLVDERTAGEPAATDEGRFQFLKLLVEQHSLQTSGLTCLQCKLDGTVPYDKKILTYTHSKLDQHLKQGYHSRQKQLLRAWAIDFGQGRTSGDCPLCGKKLEAGRFLTHLGKEHDEQFAD